MPKGTDRRKVPGRAQPVRKRSHDTRSRERARDNDLLDPTIVVTINLFETQLAKLDEMADDGSTNRSAIVRDKLAAAGIV